MEIKSVESYPQGPEPLALSTRPCRQLCQRDGLGRSAQGASNPCLRAEDQTRVQDPSMSIKPDTLKQP